FGDSNGVQMHVTDGTWYETFFVTGLDASLNLNSSVPFGPPIVINGDVYFARRSFLNGNQLQGTELWAWNGELDVSVHMVKEINPGTGSSLPLELTVFGESFMFSAADGTNGRELWISDGTEAGTVLVKDINPGVAGSFPSELVNIGRTLFF